MIDWKIVIIFAGFALFISFITGVFSGVGFGDVFLRAILWAIVFGGIGVGVSAAISRFLPDLKEVFDTSGSRVKDPEKDPESGEEVDIVLPDENPHAKRASNADEDDYEEEIESIDEPGAGGELKTSPSLRNGEGDEDNFEGIGLDSEGGNEETADDIPLNKAVEKEAARKSQLEDTAENLEEIGNDPFAGGSELDSLPDLDKFSGSFSGFDDFDKVTSGSSSSFQTKEDVEISGTKHDPTKAAKAIQTWMQRDKEG